MDALHYVCVDVTSNASAVWMTYYTHRRYMSASHHAYYSAACVFHYTHDSNTDGQHHVWDDVHSKYTVEKKFYILNAGSKMFKEQHIHMWNNYYITRLVRSLLNALSQLILSSNSCTIYYHTVCYWIGSHSHLACFSDLLISSILQARVIESIVKTTYSFFFIPSLTTFQDL